MIQLRPMIESEYMKIVEWNRNKDEDFLYQWAGHRAYQYPISTEQIKAWNQNENTILFAIHYKGETVGSVELDEINTTELSARVCRFILCDEVKNKGIGTLALRQLAALALNDLKLSRLSLGVFCYNVDAIRCYEKCGFLVKEYREHDNAKWNAYIMELSASRHKELFL